MERDDHAKLMRMPVQITLGGEVYSIEPLGIRKASIWMAKLMDVVARHDLGKTMFSADGIVIDFTKPELAASMMRGLADIADLVFEFAGFSPEQVQRIDAVAEGAEIIQAFSALIAIASPFRSALAGVSEGLSSNTPNGSGNGVTHELPNVS